MFGYSGRVDHLLMISGPEVEHSFSSHQDPFQALHITLSVFQYSVLIMMGVA